MGFGSWLKKIGKKIWGGIKTVARGAVRGVKWFVNSPIGQTLINVGTKVAGAINPAAGAIAEKGANILKETLGKDNVKDAIQYAADQTLGSGGLAGNTTLGQIYQKVGGLPYGGVNLGQEVV